MSQVLQDFVEITAVTGTAAAAARRSAASSPAAISVCATARIKTPVLVTFVASRSDGHKLVLLLQKLPQLLVVGGEPNLLQVEIRSQDIAHDRSKGGGEFA